MTLNVLNPYNQNVFAEPPFDTNTQIGDKLDVALRAFAMWRRLPLEERINCVKKGLDYLQINKEVIAKEISCQMGKPISQSRNEFSGFFERAEHMLDIASETLVIDTLPALAGFHRRIEHEPLGVVLDIAAWKYPLFIAVNVVFPALLA